MHVTKGVRRRGGASNVYLVEDAGLTLVDAGTPWDEGLLRDLLVDAGHRPTGADRVLRAHYDLDHVGALGQLGTDCPVYAADPVAAYLAGERRPPWSRRRVHPNG